MALQVKLPLTIWRESIRIERHGPGQTLIVPQEQLLTRSRIGCDPKGV
jgi:hypothetical protein